MEGLDAEFSENFTLISNDSKKIECNVKLIKAIPFFQGLFEMDPNTTECKLDFSSKCIEHFLEFVKNNIGVTFKKIEEPLLSLQKSLSEDNYNFVNSMTNMELVELLTFSDFLQYTDLYEIMCATISSRISGKGREEISREFNGALDLTKEEYQEAIKEIAWAGDPFDGKWW